MKRAFFNIDSLPFDIKVLFRYLNKAYSYISTSTLVTLDELEHQSLVSTNDEGIYHISILTKFNNSSGILKIEFIVTTDNKGGMTGLKINLTITHKFSLKLYDNLLLKKPANYPEMIVLYFDDNLDFHHYTLENDLMMEEPLNPNDYFYALDAHVEVYPDKKNIIIEANSYRENENFNKIVRENVDDELVYKTLLFLDLFYQLNTSHIKEIFELPNLFDAQKNEDLLSFYREFVQIDRDIIEQKLSLFRMLSC